MADRRVYEDVRVEGHLIDSGILSRIMDDVMDLEGEFETLTFDIGRTNTDPSVLVMRIFGSDDVHLAHLMAAVQESGAVPLEPEDAHLAPAPADGVFPEGFYSTSNLDTFVRLNGQWTEVVGTEMDLGVRVDCAAGTARAMPMAEVTAGDTYVVDRPGVRVVPIERPREKQPFEFMASAVSSEKPKKQIVGEVSRLLRRTKAEGKRIIAVVGPAVVHTGAAGQVSRLVEMGYVDVLFGGNAVATHDIEAALYGTSLGVRLEDGRIVPGGHEHHLRAINTIRAEGGIREAVASGVLDKGLMHTLVKHDVPFVLAGSIRDDGPLPDVITDVVEAQSAMREWCRDAGACLMLSTMLHAIATGNMLPASTYTVCVDINPAVVTKLADRGSWQTIGIVTDVGLFLEQLAGALGEE